MNKNSYIYILSSKPHGVLYIGVTNDLIRRVYEHKHGLIKGFSNKYHIKQLVYYEHFLNIEEAIHREKCVKRWKREWKVELIESMNPGWNDLYDDIVNEKIPAFAGMTE